MCGLLSTERLIFPPILCSAPPCLTSAFTAFPSIASETEYFSVFNNHLCFIL